MSDPFIGEIRLFGGNFAPRDWAFCNGATLAIAQNDALYALIGTTYGGDGISTFNLPDLRGRVPIHQGQGPGLFNRTMGEMGGTEEVTLTINQTASHSHAIQCATAGADRRDPNGAYLAADATAAVALYGPGPANAAMAPAAGELSGGSQPHENRMPSLAVSYIIALLGIFPPRA